MKLLLNWERMGAELQRELHGQTDVKSRQVTTLIFFFFFKHQKELVLSFSFSSSFFSKGTLATSQGLDKEKALSLNRAQI